MLLYSVLRGRIFKARAKQDILKGGGGVEVCSPKKLLILHTYPDPLQPRHRDLERRVASIPRSANIHKLNYPQKCKILFVSRRKMSPENMIKHPFYFYKQG